MELATDQVALLSGCGAGLGRDIALKLAQEGANLVLSARKPDIIESIAQEVHALGRECETVTGDITSVSDCERITNAAIARFGRIDTLVNIAYQPDWPKRMKLTECEPDLSNWRACFEVNTFATMQMTRQVALHMVRQQSGRIIMINTMTADKVQPGAYAYAGSKIALQRMTRILAMELGEHNIRVNSMHPGFMVGPQNVKVMAERAEKAGTSIEEERAKVAAETALRYLAPTEEYARVVLFLASPLSDAITGQSIHVNGGHFFY
jgi:NAD(P)-dependent dehydrogenase (short-subunit alcohol dehydrogenase family)